MFCITFNSKISFSNHGNTCRSGPTEDGAFALFFRPHPGGFDNARVPTPVTPESARGGGGLGATGIDWCQLHENFQPG